MYGGTMTPQLPSHPHTFSFAYTTHVPSPLSSSPLRPSPTPSPLSDRDPNSTIWSANNNDHKMSSPTPSPSKPTHSEKRSFTTLPPRTRQASLPSPPPSRGKESVFSKRISKPNPLLSGTREEKAETRRKLFLKKVKQGADEKKWERRGGDEEVMRVLWASEERERRIRERVLADSVGGIGDEELNGGIEEEMFDEVEVAVREERELEALVGDWMAGSSQSEAYVGSQDVGNERREMDGEHYGSDEEDYDQVFLEMMEDERRVASQQQQQYQEDHDMMDMS